MPRRRQRDQWGSISYDPKKKVGVIRYWASLDSRGYMRHCKTVHGTRAEVEEVRAKLMLAHGKDAPCPTVNDMYVKYYWPSRVSAVDNGTLVKKTADDCASYYEKRIKPTWGNVPLDQVKPLGVQKWLNGLIYTVAIKCLPIFRKIMTYGVRYGYIDNNPINESYDMPSKKTMEKRDDGIWDSTQLPEVWRVAWNTWIEGAVLLQGFASCRFGESLSVKGTDVVDLSTGGITIAGIIIDSQINGENKDVSRTKNEQSVRIAVMAGYPAKRMLYLAEKAGDAYITSDGFGGAPSQPKVRRHFESIVKGSDVTYHVMKNLRKSWQTIARWKLKLDPIYSEPMMGHKMPGVTGAHYDRPTADMFAEVLAEHYAKFPFADKLEWQRSTGFDWGEE